MFLLKKFHFVISRVFFQITIKVKMWRSSRNHHNIIFKWKVEKITCALYCTLYFSTSIVVSTLVKWGPVSHFGCSVVSPMYQHWHIPLQERQESARRKVTRETTNSFPVSHPLNMPPYTRRRTLSQKPRIQFKTGKFQ